MEKLMSETVSSLAAVVISVIAWVFMAFITVVLHLSGLIFFLPLSLVMDRGTRKQVHRVSRAWGKCLIFAMPLWKLEVEGRDNLDPKEHYVIVANHQSLIDILVVLVGIKNHFKFMAKKELFPIPMMGWHMSISKYIPIDRASKDSARDAIFLARKNIQDKVSVLFFPEGTRSQDGQIKAFKAGAFKVALDEKVKILPVVIDGTQNAIPKHSKIVRHKSLFRLRICKPIDPQQIEGGSSVDAVREAVREQMIAELAMLRKGNS